MQHSEQEWQSNDTNGLRSQCRPWHLLMIVLLPPTTLQLLFRTLISCYVMLLTSQCKPQGPSVQLQKGSKPLSTPAYDSSSRAATGQEPGMGLPPLFPAVALLPGAGYIRVKTDLLAGCRDKL